MLRRHPEAVRELEALQQQERQSAGEPTLTPEDFLQRLREDIHLGLISDQLDAGGLSAVIKEAGANDQRAEQIAAARLAEWRLDDPSQWSRYESPGIRWGIANLCTRIETTFARHGWRLPEAPVVGTLTTGQVSAVTQMTAAGAPLVLIDNGFFKFSGILSQLTVFGSHDVQRGGGFTDATLQLLSDLVATHTVLNTCLYVFARKTPPNFETEVAGFQDAISLFVISHEYAHISTGDLDAHPAHPGPTGMGVRSREFDADRRGFITSVEAAQDAGVAGLGVFGPFLYFAGLDVLSRAASAYRGQAATFETDPLSDTYPTPYERTVSLLNWLETDPYGDRLRNQIQSAAATYHLILSAWDLILPVFWAVRDQLAAFDPSTSRQPVLPEVATFGLVQTLWQHVLSFLRQTR